MIVESIDQLSAVDCGLGETLGKAREVGLRYLRDKRDKECGLVCQLIHC